MAMRRFLHALGIALFGSVLATAACSSSSGNASCANLDVCPKDPPLTQSEIAQCNQLLADPKCGATFQAYLNCAVSQEKCTSSGTLDMTGFQAAVEMNCASNVAAVQNCGGVVVDGGNNCGFPGQACCTTGTPCQDGCCDPANNQCVVSGQTCSGGSTVCSGVGGTCQACGAPGQPCCSGINCTGGCCDTSANPSVCVARGGMCTPTGTIQQVCPSSGSFCESCGSDGSPCCPGNVCSGGSGLYCDSTNTCSLCGNDGEQCCPGNQCTGGGLVCNTAGGTPICQLCGSFGEPCCATGMACTSGYVCQAGTCQSCGSSNQPCCPGNTCIDRTYVCTTGTVCNPSGSTCCQSCGNTSEPCCTTGTACFTGVCSAGTCM